MAESQEERVLSEGPPLCTSLCRNSLMEVNIVEPLVFVASGISENLPYDRENLAGDVAGHDQQSNKALQPSDISEVGSEEMELGDELPDHGCLQEDEIPRVGIRFAQLEMANDFYVTYAKKIGFATKIRTTTYDKITKIPVNQAIHCNRDGICGSRVKAPIRKNTIFAAGCKARIYVKFDKDMQDWILFKVDLRHSHPCSARKAVHYHEYRKLSMHAKCVIENNDEAGIRPNKTFLALANEAGGPSNLGFSEKYLRNYITARLRTSNVDADVREMMSYFMRMKEINPNFFYAVKLDEDCKFRSAVWVDARCRASYEYYRDVVSFDSTYSTNRHGLPFVSFVGVKHHGRSTLLGCALLGNEEIASYEWVFSQWVKCVGTVPQRIITDQYLYDDRRMWVPICFKCEFWAAMRSTQRSESMHAFYGGYLHSKTSLVQFVHEYDNVLGVKEQRKLEDDAADLRGVISCATSSPIEKQFQQEYTTSMFRDVQTEFIKKANCRVSIVVEDGPSVSIRVEEEKLVNDTIICISYDLHFDRTTQEVRCECNLFESSGVLCYHCLEVFHSYKVYKVPPCYVLPRWSKKVKCKHTYVRSSHDVSRSDESHVAFMGLCAQFYNVAQEFVGDDDETSLLHAALDETRTKLAAHRAKKRSETVSDAHASFGSQSSNDISVDDIQGPSKVATKGRPKSKRLGAALEKSFKNSARRNHKKSPPVFRPHASQDVNLPSVVGRNVPLQVGGFMSLLSSFNKN
ncbi:protein FAR1-RELATED SEQUENCE 5-like [Arachis ipaensis]|uniref:protein FAR1-RELATED SEQUENCE 5-like n=1 Tax=Arachis ipaensis TaxID=130454 RepID=UPI000A2B8BED|nr:protein FAR1-RELATED SEQUENCE 5-like [Arachis ipaensis]